MLKNKQELIRFFEDRKAHGIKPGLERINQLLHLVGNPQNKMQAIHVAGTNGKGSTVSYLKNALIANGYRVGVFASPSLEGLTGHIFCNDEKITDDLFLLLLNEIYPSIQELDEKGNHPTEFEIITVLAFVYFASHVDIALIEAGMGGREDTTNCFIPILSIITNVDFDHTTFLGKTIQTITSHKAGIIKKDIPVITGETKREALLKIEQEALANDAPLYQLYKHFHYTHLQRTRKYQQFKWIFGVHQHYIEMKMYGEHQVKNCSLALMAIDLLKEAGMSIEWGIAINGINQTQVPGRFERISEQPTIVLDGAHNPAGIQTFLETVNKLYANEERHLIFTAFKDKDLRNMLEQLLPHFTTITLTTFDHPRAIDEAQLHKLITAEKKYVVGNWKEVLNRINDESEQDNAYYFITGSLHFIAAVREYIKTK